MKVPGAGIEPARTHRSLVFETSASTNSAIQAFFIRTLGLQK